MPTLRRNHAHGITLGLDLGSTTIKAVAVDGTGTLRGFLKAEKDSAGSSATAQTARRLAEEFNLDWKRLKGINLTGVGSQRTADEINGIPVRRVDEFSALGRGALALAGRDRAIVASMGTGTALVLAGPEGARHLGGTGVGGGAISGLCRHLYGLRRFPDILTLSEKGDLHKVDLKIGDLPDNEYLGLSPNLTLANFAKIDERASREDIILGLVNMVLETIGMMSVMACRGNGMDTVVLCGALTLLPQLGEVFGRFTEHTGVTFIVPGNSTYAIAYGAALEGISNMNHDLPPAAKPPAASRRPGRALTPTAREMLREFENRRNPEQAANLMRFFKTGPGQYGEGDHFLGLKVPVTRSIVKSYQDRLCLDDLNRLLDSEWHEIRLAALLMLANTAERLEKKGDKEGLEALFRLYDLRLDRANNWDLVDLSVYRFMGAYWRTMRTPARRIRDQLDAWAESGNLWRERAAVIATFALLREGKLRETFRLAERFADHPHDLMHKATGWMLREAGKRDIEALRDFLERFRHRLPRTALRYAIELMQPDERRKWMAKEPSAPRKR